MEINTLVRRAVPAGALLLLPVLAAACGGATQSRSGLAAEIAARGRYQCVPEATAPAGLAPSDFADVPRLASGVRTLLDGAREERGEVVLTLEFQGDGLNTRRMVIWHDLSPTLADSVQQLVFASLVPAPPHEGTWGVRLRVRAAPEVGLSLEPREYCPPRPRDPQMESSIYDVLGSGIRYRGGVRERIIFVSVQVHPLGFVEGARILRGGAPGSPLERDLAEYVRRFSFHPASLDGVPVRGEIAVPVRVRD